MGLEGPGRDAVRNRDCRQATNNRIQSADVSCRQNLSMSYCPACGQGKGSFQLHWQKRPPLVPLGANVPKSKRATSLQNCQNKCMSVISV